MNMNMDGAGGVLDADTGRAFVLVKRFISFLLFSGHKFPSLNPSISDKENIQTLAADSGRRWDGGGGSITGHVTRHVTPQHDWHRMYREKLDKS